jgi:hypothetical protein
MVDAMSASSKDQGAGRFDRNRRNVEEDTKQNIFSENCKSPARPGMNFNLSRG